MIRVINSFGVMVRVKVGIRLYVNRFVRLQNTIDYKKPKSHENVGERISKSQLRIATCQRVLRDALVSQAAVARYWKRKGYG